ncbi:MAG: SDR family oxidoreductase [Coriobacteriales bacterium]|jgi:NAD(P)-dependent dehydrogenase (short-subunit alcohol dehydrogenase family)|nr:SDR family oxidoreductase [Coriobacteriales bacterium]
MDKLQLSKKVVIVTGASSGMGKRSAELFAEAGASVLMIARRKERLEALKSEITEKGGIADYHVADLTIEDNCKAAVNSCIEKFGRVDGLVNCAGMTVGIENLEGEFDTKLWTDIIQMDLFSLMFLIKYAYPQMEKVGGGSIVNVASFAALQYRLPLVSGLAYGTAKGAVKAMSMALGGLLAPLKIRVNCIYPGFIRTEMSEQLFQPGFEEIRNSMVSAIPLKTHGMPDDIAYCALYLISDASGYITGQDFVVDGGYMI